MTFLLTYWRWIALALLLAAAAAFGGSVVYRHMDGKLRALQSDFDQFRGGVEALGKAAEKRARETELANVKRKQDADAQSAKSRRDLDGLYAAYVGLRDSRNPGGRILPPTAPGAASPERTAFDRIALDNALSDFDRGVTVLLREGDQAIIDLNTAKTWAASTGSNR